MLRSGAVFLVGGTAVKFIDDGQTVQVDAGQLPHADPSQPRARSSDTMTGEEEVLDLEVGEPVLLDEDDGSGSGGRGGGGYGIGSFAALLKVGQNVPYGLSKVALINARGQTVHSASGADKRAKGSGAEAIDIMRLLLLGCIRSGASDIHMEPKREGGLVRLRIDGAMVEVSKVDIETYRRISSLVKVLGDIDIAKKGTVQEGHFSVKVPDRRIDYRISFTPSMYGQKLVVRVLDPKNAPQHLQDLYMQE